MGTQQKSGDASKAGSKNGQSLAPLFSHQEVNKYQTLPRYLCNLNPLYLWKTFLLSLRNWKQNKKLFYRLKKGLLIAETYGSGFFPIYGVFFQLFIMNSMVTPPFAANSCANFSHYFRSNSYLLNQNYVSLFVYYEV